MTLTRLSHGLLLCIIGGYLVLNYGFQQLRIPPGAAGGVPLGECALVAVFLTVNYRRLAREAAEAVPMAPFVLWGTLNLIRLASDTQSHGWWALRDASHALESAFILAGFVLSRSPASLERVFRWLPRVLAVGGIYALTYPMAAELARFSPHISNANAVEVPLLFCFTNTATVCLLAAVNLALPGTRTGERRGPWCVPVALLLIVYSIMLFQARKIYLQVIALALFFLFFRGSVFRRIASGVLLLVGVLALLSLLEVEVRGRVGQIASIDFVLKHFAAIWGEQSPEAGSSAAGTLLRVRWFVTLYHRWTADLFTILFGLGYGTRLIDFGLTREPHNSYITLLARLGVMGAFAFAWMHITLIRAWHRTYRAAEALGWIAGRNFLLLAMSYFVLIWVDAIGQSAFEVPFNAIPYYFFWGIVLRMAWHLKAT